MKRIPWLLAVLGLVCSASAQAQQDPVRGRRELLQNALSDRPARPARPPLPLGTTELILDGGFEDGQAPSGQTGNSGMSGPWGWTSSGGVNPVWHSLTGGPTPHSGNWYLYLLGGAPNGQETAAQLVTIPASSTATLSFWLHVISLETILGTHDRFDVQLYKQDGTFLATLATFWDRDNDLFWEKKSFDLSQYAGQTLYVLFGTIQGNNTVGTLFNVDDVSLIATTSGGGAACTPDSQTLCLFSNRFKVTAQYDTYGAPGTFLNATATPFSDNTGFFTTVVAGNVDVVVKLVDFCSLNNTWSTYIGGTTDLGVKITITDTSTGRVYPASNSHGNAWNLIRGVAFSCP
jgi:hypothetical protein